MLRMRKKILRADIRSTSFYLGSNIYVALRGPDACYCCCVCLFVCWLVGFFLLLLSSKRARPFFNRRSKSFDS